MRIGTDAHDDCDGDVVADGADGDDDDEWLMIDDRSFVLDDWWLKMRICADAHYDNDDDVAADSDDAGEERLMIDDRSFVLNDR